MFSMPSAMYCICSMGLTHFQRSQLQWLDVVDWVRFRVCVQVFRCLHKMAPEYLSTYCQPISSISGRRHLWSADRGDLDFPRVKLALCGGRSFAYAGPSNWNSIHAYLRDSSFLFHLLSTTSKPGMGSARTVLKLEDPKSWFWLLTILGLGL